MKWEHWEIRRYETVHWEFVHDLSESKYLNLLRMLSSLVGKHLVLITKKLRSSEARSQL